MGNGEIVLGLIDLDCDINARDHKGIYFYSCLFKLKQGCKIITVGHQTLAN